MWKNTKKLEKVLNTEVKKSILLGNSTSKIAFDLEERMKTGLSNSLRLVRTETMHHLNDVSLKSMKKDGVTKVKEVVTLDERTSSECKAHHGKIHDIEKAPILPRHPNCRCVLVPVIDEGEENGKIKERIKFSEKEEFNNSTPVKFSEAVKEAKQSVGEKDRWRVTAYEQEHYVGSKLHTTKKGSTVAIDKSGDIISVCHKNGDEIRGYHLLEEAVKNGGIKLDSFSGNHKFYSKNGFEAISYCEFDEEFAPDGWVNGKNEFEDIVFYKYTGKKELTFWEDIKNNVKKFDDYDSAMNYRDKELKNEL